MTTTRGLPVRVARFGVATLLVLVLTILLLEAGARLLGDALDLSPYMRYDETLGWTAIEGASKRHRDRGGQFEVTYDINANGFRGPEYPLARTPATYRIVVIGDSNGFGWGVPWERTFSGILDRELEDAEVINLALAGYGLDQSYLRFQAEGAAYAPDLVVIQSTANDFEEIMYAFFNQKPKPQFERSADDRLVLSNVPVRADSPEARRFHDQSLPVPCKEWLGWNSFAFNAANSFYHGLIRGEAHRLPAGEEKVNERSIWVYNGLLRMIEQEVAAAGAQGLLVHSIRQVSGTNQVVAGKLRVLDLHPVFVARGHGDRAGHFFKDGYHWNELGHRAAADELIAAIGALRSKTVNDVAIGSPAQAPPVDGSAEQLQPVVTPK